MKRFCFSAKGAGSAGAPNLSSRTLCVSKILTDYDSALNDSRIGELHESESGNRDHPEKRTHDYKNNKLNKLNKLKFGSLCSYGARLDCKLSR